MSRERAWKRILLGAVGWPVFFASLVWAPLWVNFGLFALAAFLAGTETYELMVAQELSGHYKFLAGSFAAGAVLVMVLPLVVEARFGLVGVLLLAACAVQWLLFLDSSASSAQPFTSVLCFVGTPLALLALLLQAKSGRVWVAFMFAGTWSRDAGAFVVGTLVPHARPIATHISPRKTWVGAVGGIGGASLCCVGFSLQWPELIPLPHALILGGLLGILGQVGDLFESALKRRGKARHSGTILGEQGGILDTIDGHLFTIPAVMIYAFILHQVSQ